MEHVVFFPAHDGSPAFRRVAERDEAIRLVEHLRNVEGVSEVSVHALAEVPLAFKAWYRVEVPTEAAPAVASLVDNGPVDSAPLDSAVDSADVEALEAIPMQAPVLAASNGRTVEAPTSLGFFAS